jgi:polysaccharide biosynthesis protein PslH
MEAWLRILWLKTELLHPVDKGGRIRTYQMLRELKREHYVTYLTLDDGTAAPDAAELAAEYCDELVRIPFRRTTNFSLRFWFEVARSVLSPLPYTISRYRSAAFRDALGRLAATGSFDVIVCDFLTPAINVPAALPCPAVLFQHNVEAAIWRRHYEVARGPLHKAFLWLEWRRVRLFERRACHRFDHVITVSEEDRTTTLNEYGVAASAVPTGVDTAYFRPAVDAQRRPHHLVFTGSMDWLPNIDGMKYFVREVLPLVKDKVPDVTLTIVGREQGADVRALAAEAGITVTGRVPDVRPYIDEAAAFIVPLRIGGGTRLKIYEAMAMECPVVSTTVGAEGLPLKDGSEILLADASPAFADAVVRVITDTEFGAKLARRGADEVRTRFGWHRAAQEFVRLVEVHTDAEHAIRSSAGVSPQTSG